VQSLINNYNSCGQCSELPCNKFIDLKDPEISDEQHYKSIDERASRLKDKEGQMRKKQWYETLFENYAEKYDKECFTQGTMGECDFLEKELNFDKSLKLSSLSVFSFLDNFLYPLLASLRACMESLTYSPSLKNILS